MKKWLTSIIISALVMGCAETKNVPFDAPVATPALINLNAILWTPIKIPSNIEFQIDSSNQLLLNEQSGGPVASFILPKNNQPLTIKLQSFVNTETSFYAPNVLILNKNNDVVDKKSFANFEYVPAKLLDNDKFVLEFTVMPDSNGDQRKLLVYTRAHDLQGATPILHPAKAFAIAKNTVLPAIADPLAQHSRYGNFSLSVTSNNGIKKHILETTDNVPVAIALEQFYKQKIVNAVQHNDIPQALALLEEAKELNIAGTQDAFINALNRNK